MLREFPPFSSFDLPEDHPLGQFPAHMSAPFRLLMYQIDLAREGCPDYPDVMCVFQLEFNKLYVRNVESYSKPPVGYPVTMAVDRTLRSWADDYLLTTEYPGGRYIVGTRTVLIFR